jgi:predicted transposase/invertase (TIGR01784 family)
MFEMLCKRKQESKEEFDKIVQEILGEIKNILLMLEKYEETKTMDERTKDIILSATMEMYKHLHKKYIRDKSVRGKVDNMIESVLQKARKNGVAEGIELGMEKGMEKGVKTVAKNLLGNGTDEATIMKVTGLSKKELDAIKKDL